MIKYTKFKTEIIPLEIECMGNGMESLKIPPEALTSEDLEIILSSDWYDSIEECESNQENTEIRKIESQ